MLRFCAHAGFPLRTEVWPVARRLALALALSLTLALATFAIRAATTAPSAPA
jgi:hypothetical protein